MTRRLPVSAPFLGEAEASNVLDALSHGAISGSVGEYLPAFERGFAKYCDCQFGVAVSSGTAALQLALATLRIGPGDEVLASSLTSMATFFAILHQGAVPVPVDIDDATWNIDPALLEARITGRTRAILVVHLFGHPVDMDPVMELAKRFGLSVIEDCAEAHGALYKGRKVGGIGDIGCFSFYANKIITTGEGGMLTLNDPGLAARASSLKNLAFGSGTGGKFMHTDVGFNFRLTNIQAAIGCAQLERLDDIIGRKRGMALRYGEILADVSSLQLPIEQPYARNVYWMYHVGVRDRPHGARDDIMRALAGHGIETREGFVPANDQEAFLKMGWTRRDDCPKASRAGATTFYLPSGPLLTNDEIDFVAHTLHRIMAAV